MTTVAPAPEAQESTTPNAAPRSVACRFGESARGVSAARALTRGFFTRVHPGSPSDLEDAALVVSELVTNAIRHGHGPGTLTLIAHPDGLDIAVTDPSPEFPHPRAPDTDNGTGGWGWYLISAVCDRLDASGNAAGGKTVRAHLPWT